MGGINSKVSGREVRRQMGRTSAVLDGAIIPALEGCLANQGVAQQRIETLEAWQGRGFWGRMKWLLTGK